MNHQLFFRLLCLATAIGVSSYVYLTLLGDVPLWRLNTLMALALMLLVFWVGRLVWEHAIVKAPPQPGDWVLLDKYAANAFYVPAVWGTWFLLPFVPQEGRLVAVFFLYVSAMVNTLGSIRHAPATGRDALSPLVIPISTVPFIVIYLDYMTAGIAVMFVCSTIALFAFRRATQELLNTAYYAQQESERERDAKNRFIASASHDLQQPIQAAGLSFDQVLTRDGEARDKAVRRVRWALDTTGQLLVRMTEYLQLQAGQLSAKQENVAIGPAIARSTELYEPAAAAQSVSIHSMPSQHVVQGDPTLIDRVLANYLTNAIKHAAASRILIGARRHQGGVRIWVIDDGVGIDTGDQAQLFDDYFQGSDHGDHERGGFGLGLASAKRMAELMGGSAGHEKRWANGSAFWFELPAT